MAVTSSGTITSTTVNGTSRITGLSSGVDVDSMVEQMMAAEKIKLNKMKQAQQLVEWRQEAYQTVINKIQTFSDTYFSLTSSKSLINQATYLQYSTTSSNTAAVTATASSSATVGTHTLTVSQLATAATRESAGSISKSVQGDGEPDFSAAQDQSFSITLDGTTRTVTIDSSVTDVDSLQDVIDSAVGEGKLVVSTNDDGYLVIKEADDSGVQKITLGSTSSSALEALGFGDDSTLTNRLSTSDTLETIANNLENPFDFNDDGQIVFTLNDIEFTFDKDETLAEMINEINQSDAGVTLTYNELRGKLVLTAKDTGAGDTISVSEEGSNFFDTVLSEEKEGTDANLTVDGIQLTRSSNSVIVDGVTYKLKSVTTDAVTVDVEQDTDSIYEAISGFVEDYNNLIAFINAELDADYDYDYPPLTEDQEEEMSDDEIEDWETKAKTGLLEDDPLLRSFLTKLRTSLMDPVAGVGTYLSSIGITTEDYTEQGKLTIDETTLKQAIEDDPEGVKNLFSQQSSSYSGTTTVRTLNAEARAVRYKEEGIAYRFYDVLQDNIGTIRNSAGNKGLLIMKAGLDGDSTETSNTLTELIEKYQTRIDAEEERLEDKEDYYYAKFTAMETYINTLSSQLAVFSSDS